MEKTIYKVLWVDDQEEIVAGYQFQAGLRNIQLIHKADWASAKEILEKEFDELTAIILDAHCKLDAKSSAFEYFLGQAAADLQVAFGKKQRFIPWYVLSNGTMNSFDSVIGMINSSARQQLESEWGKVLYIKDQITKDKENNELFNNIRKVGDTREYNLILARHSDCFHYIGTEKLIGGDARKILLKALAAHYYPEQNLGYEFAGNPLRKVIEYMFRGALNYGLVTDKLLDDGKIRIWDTMQYLCGMDTNVGIRYGKKGVNKDYSDYESVLPTSCYNLFKGLLNFVNVDSHTTDEDDENPFKINADTQSLFFGYLFQLLYLITYFGKFIESHQDVEANKAMVRICTKKERKENKEKIEQLEKHDEPILTVEKPSTDTVIGKECIALNQGTYQQLGPCKVSPELKLSFGKKYVIDEVIYNEDSDASKHPFIVTKVTSHE